MPGKERSVKRSEAQTLQAKKDFIAHYRKQHRSGWLGRGREMFLEHPNWIRFLAGKSSQGGKADVRDLKELGDYGALASAALTLVSRPYVYRRRKRLVKTIQMFVSAGRTQWFRRLVSRTSRLLYDNYSKKGTPLHDPQLEKAIFEVFGELARNSESFNKKHDVSDKWSPQVLGKTYFKELIRNELVLNFRHLMKVYRHPESMKAIRYCLIGEALDELTERADFNRLRFISSIFQHEVPILTQFQGRKGMKSRVWAALISMEAKAKNYLEDAREQERFMNKVFNYYDVKRLEVDSYAFDAYAKWKQETASRRSMDEGIRELGRLVEKIKKIYPIEILENAASHLKRRMLGTRRESTEPRRIILTPGAQFELETGRSTRARA